MNVPKRVSVPWNSLRPQIARVLRPQAQSAQTSGLLQEIDHVAIAVRDLEAAIEWYRRAFGAVVVHREVVERDQVEEALHRGVRLVHPAAHPDRATRRRWRGSWKSAARASTTSATG